MAGVVVFEPEALISPDQLALQLFRNSSAVFRFSGPRFFRSAPSRPEQQLREAGEEYLRWTSAPGFPMGGPNHPVYVVRAAGRRRSNGTARVYRTGFRNAIRTRGWILAV